MAPIRPLAWEPPYALEAALEKAKRQTKKKKRRGDSRHSYLVSDFNRKSFSFSPLNFILAVGLSDSFYYVEICSLYTYFVNFFYHEWMLNFIKFFCIY